MFVLVFFSLLSQLCLQTESNLFSERIRMNTFFVVVGFDGERKGAG